MKSIILTTREVRGLLDGTITMIRREIKPQPFCHGLNLRRAHDDEQAFVATKYGNIQCTICGNIPEYSREGCDISHTFEAPFQPGDVLYGREPWQKVFETECDKDANEVNIRALIKNFDDIPKTCMGLSTEWSCKAMKPRNKYYVYKASNIEYADLENSLRWNSSITMPREAARLFLCVDDVRAERVQDITLDGCRKEGCCCSDCPQTGEHSDECKCDTRYHNTWNDENAKRGLGWDANPWTWVYTVKTISADEARELENGERRESEGKAMDERIEKALAAYNAIIAEEEWDDAKIMSALVDMVAAITSGITMNRLTEICAAEREKRLIVLPVGIGKTIYMANRQREGHTHDYVFEHKIDRFEVIAWSNKGAYISLMDGDKVTEYYDTEPAAQAALDKEAENGTH